MKQKLLGLGFAVTALALTAPFAFAADADLTTMTQNIRASSTETLTTVINNNLPAIITVAVALIAAGFVWGRFRKHVAGKKI